MATASFVSSCDPADDSDDSDNTIVSAIRPNESISQQIPIEKTPSDDSGPDTVSSYSFIAASQSRIRRSHVWNPENGEVYTDSNEKLRWRCIRCKAFDLAMILLRIYDLVNLIA